MAELSAIPFTHTQNAPEAPSIPFTHTQNAPEAPLIPFTHTQNAPQALTQPNIVIPQSAPFARQVPEPSMLIPMLLIMSMFLVKRALPIFTK
ncbi:MAG: PEP-CTERM sorting domain-containing protein [Rhizonema sp. NSF051]|nr:PEP-CTERM sorting domain-containing protein [Rhizonema sp. NSF051]